MSSSRTLPAPSRTSAQPLIHTPQSRLLPLALSLWALSAGSLGAADFVPASVDVPQPQREFRAAWVATVKNIDWPSQPGLTTARQKDELVSILNRAAQLKFNAVILQVRPACDAFYSSSIEPWSEYLSGQMGRAPEPFYDPLAFAVDEAHRRGLELHAWFNPYRARHPSARSSLAPTHISKTHPELVRRYGPYLWLDPGEPSVQDYSLRVILDVVKRYDVDGIHLDDYFYPYPERDSAKRLLPFPDEASWQRYGAGGQLARDDWRRENVNRFIERLYSSIKREKPWVKFGISPFGIWRPHQPASIEGFDPYAVLYADSRKWLLNGWVDYFSPQLYWAIAPAAQSYPALLAWWAAQNPKSRHLWPGNNTVKVGNGWAADELLNQIQLTRRQPGADGNIHWSMRALVANRGGIADALARTLYAQPALVPASPWLDNRPPAKPTLRIQSGPGQTSRICAWQSAGGEPAHLWVLEAKFGDRWVVQILPGSRDSCLFNAALPDVIAVAAVDRCGNRSPWTILQRRP